MYVVLGREICKLGGCWGEEIGKRGGGWGEGERREWYVYISGINLMYKSKVRALVWRVYIMH